MILNICRYDLYRPTFYSRPCLLSSKIGSWPPRYAQGTMIAMRMILPPVNCPVEVHCFLTVEAGGTLTRGCPVVCRHWRTGDIAAHRMYCLTGDDGIRCAGTASAWKHCLAGGRKMHWTGATLMMSLGWCPAWSECRPSATPRSAGNRHLYSFYSLTPHQLKGGYQYKTSWCCHCKILCARVTGATVICSQCLFAWRWGPEADSGFGVTYCMSGIHLQV